MVTSLLGKVETLRSQIESVGTYKWKTNCIYNGVNLRVIGIQEVLEFSFQFVSKKSLLGEVLTQLELPSSTKCTFGGYSAEDWLSDCRHRVRVVQVNDKKATLKTLEKQLNALMSDEVRREIELKRIQNTLNEL